MKQILFLDDAPERCKAFKAHFPFADIVETAQEAIDKLAAQQYDILFLDYDLGGEIYVSSETENCGYTVAKWLVNNRDFQPTVEYIFVHSLNYNGAKNMVSLLTSCFEHRVYHIPFINFDWESLCRLYS